MHILHNVLSTFPFWAADMENLFNIQEFFLLVIISFILVTLMFDAGWYCKEKYVAIPNRSHVYRDLSMRQNDIKYQDFLFVSDTGDIKKWRQETISLTLSR